MADADTTLVIPPKLTPELSAVLGRMIFRTAPIAHLFRDTGENIPRRVEDEQAFVMHWLLTLVAEHGSAWGKFADDEVDRRKAILAARGSTQ